jgi:hypothetical protein
MNVSRVLTISNLGRHGTAVLAALALAAFTVGANDARGKSDATLAVEAASNRADLVSNGDVLVRVTLPPGLARNGKSVLALNGHALPDALHPAPDGHGFLALISGMNIGQNTVTLTVPGRSVQLPVTNHPTGGPVFSGPHLQPWICTTASAGLGAPLDADCNAAPQYAYFYKNATTAQFLAYDPLNPPSAAQIATTTTDNGFTVPYVVRVETGALNRSIYKIVVLFDPTKPWTAWAPQPQWNGKVLYMFGAGAGTQYTQGTLNNAFDDNSLSRGFATAAATLTNHGTISNTKLNAETVMMVKERLAESYGVIRYTIGTGCSGGAIQQHSIGDQYPGLLDGMLPVCSYPDIWSLYVNAHDCQLLTRYWTTTSPALWTNAADRQAVLGLPSEQECPAQDGPPAFGTRFFVVTNTFCLLPAASLYNPITNPHGVRCSMKDYHINELGVRPQDGFTYQVTDSVGVQYGLKALQGGSIAPEQFVDINEKIGGLDIDGNYIAQRTVADLTGLARMYQTGLITFGRELGKYPIIDARTNNNHEMHNNSEWIFTRNRLLRTNGNAANEIHWWEPLPAGTPAVGNVSRPSAAIALKAFNLMDQWLSAIEADNSNLSHDAKVTRNRPGEARDACTINGVTYDWTPGSPCDMQFTYTGLTRMAAGGPDTNDVLKCQLQPLNRAAYAVSFTDAQWTRLMQAFPQGVCDFAKAGVAQQPPTAPWLSFSGGPGGAPLGPPPESD